MNKAYELEYIQADTAEVKLEIMFMGSSDEAETEEFTKLLEAPIEKFNEEK